MINTLYYIPYTSIPQPRSEVMPYLVISVMKQNKLHFLFPLDPIPHVADEEIPPLISTIQLLNLFPQKSSYTINTLSVRTVNLFVHVHVVVWLFNLTTLFSAAFNLLSG